MPGPARPHLSVVIPTLNEEANLPDLLARCRAAFPDCELVVVDGGSDDDTGAVAERAGATVRSVGGGRGAQLRAGAAAASGEWLLFLHADSRLTAEAARALGHFLAQGRVLDFAYFGFRLDGQGRAFRWIELGQRLRERLFGVVLGDQGLVVHRGLYAQVGGHPEWPIFEDLEIISRLRPLGHAVPLAASLPTSPRRYRERGVIRQVAGNALLLLRRTVGADPVRLARAYGLRYPRPHGESVVVFAKAPRAGAVKTRLARDVGEEEAVRIYRALGRSVVDAARADRRRVVVEYDPPDQTARAEVVDWLGEDGVIFQPQGSGDMGQRMALGLERALRVSSAACLVGTDIAGVEPGLFDLAFEALRGRDVVLGPAADGGYYLIGCTSPHPGLFRDIPWSTDGVARATLGRAMDLGLTTAELPERHDVDTGADVPDSLRFG